MNEDQIRMFWSAYEHGANSAREIATVIHECYGISENFESFLDKVEEYAKVNLTWSLPRDGVPY
jgi:hypothetical protein